MQRRIYIVAGPNGAGKTTFARTYLPNEGHFERFINADLIAAGISPFHPEAAAIRAGRLMLEEIAACIEQGESFAFETALSGRSYAMQIPKWRESGYTVDLVFLRLRSVRLAVSRVKMRVIQGGITFPRRLCDGDFTSDCRISKNCIVLSSVGGDYTIIRAGARNCSRWEKTNEARVPTEGQPGGGRRIAGPQARRKKRP